MPPSMLEQLLKEITGYKHTTPTGTPSTPYMHGPNGLFSPAGIERDVISTRLQPRGIASMLPSRGSMVTDPLYAYITGFVAKSGTVADGVCDDPQTAGPMKNCLQTAAFGRYSFMTRELELNRLGQQTNRGEFLDLSVVNPPLLESLGNIVNPNVPGNPALAQEVLVRFMEVGIDFQNDLVRQVYAGNPANNSAGGGYKEFPGLDILIGTGKVDAITGTTCPSLDSDIKDFNYENVNTGTIVNVLSYMMRYLSWIADRTNMSPMRWAIAMRPTLFWELSAIWPCSYLTYRCASQSDDVSGTFDMGDAIAMRDDMRRNNYIIIDGTRYEVVLDDGITEDTNTNNANVPNACFASDIYVIPLTARGSLATTFWEHLDYSRGAMMGAEQGNYAPGDFWTDGGRYLWHKKPALNWCVQWLAKIEPRLILLTPHLAGRITNVVYCPLQHTRDTINTDPYWVDGGVTSRTSSTYYSDWNRPLQ